MGKVEERNFPGNKYPGLFYSNEEYDKQQQVHQDHNCDKYLGLMPCPDEDYDEWHQDYRSKCSPSAQGQPPYSTRGKPVEIDRRLDW